MSLIEKAKQISGQAVDKVGETVGELGGDDLIVKTILRVTAKKDRVNQKLAEHGSAYRITGIEVENNLPPKVVFIVDRE